MAPVAQLVEQFPFKEEVPSSSLGGGTFKMKTFFLETFGCKFNHADSDLIRGILKKNNWQERDQKKAHFFIINSCGVVEKTRLKIIKRIKEIKKRRKKIVLTGCLPLILPEVSFLVDFVFGPKEILKIPNVLEEFILKRKKIKRSFVDNQEIDKEEFFCLRERKKDQHVIATIPIGEGCLGNCVFCATKFARGRLKSFSLDLILRDIKRAIDEGFSEIDLTAQDLAVYGLDQGKLLLPRLLSEISRFKGNFKVRLGMANPYYFSKISKEIIKIFKNSEKFFRFFHLPLQSGDDRILKLMKRKSLTLHFLKIFNEIRENFRDFVLATDIICGFPGETEKSFQKTLSLIDKVKPDILHIFRFSSNRFSEKRNIKDNIPSFVKKERSRRLFDLWKKNCFQKNEKFLGKEFKILITEKRGSNFLGRMNTFRAVILEDGILGRFFRVKIDDFSFNYLKGKIIEK